MYWIVALLFACQGTEPVLPDPEPIDTGEPEREDWWVEEASGSVWVASRPFNAKVDVRYLQAMFTQEPVGGLAGLACVRGEAPCFDVIPGPGESIEADPAPDSVREQLLWVGDHLQVGSSTVSYRDDGVAAGYEGLVSDWEGPVSVPLGGELGDAMLTLAEPPGGGLEAQPDVETYLDLSSGRLDLAWTPTGEGTMLAWMHGEGLSVLFGLEDSGSVSLDVSRFLETAPPSFNVRLIRLHEDTQVTQGHTVSVVIAEEAEWEASGCAGYPEVDVTEQGPIGTGATPTYYGLAFRGVLDRGVQDYRTQSSISPLSAVMEVSLFDAAFNELCIVEFDASEMQSVDPSNVYASSGVPLWEAFIFRPSGGRSTCPEFPSFFVSDVRDYFSSLTLGVGFGPMVDLRSVLPGAFGTQWSAVEDDINAGYVSLDGFYFYEYDYGYTYELSTCGTADRSQQRPSLTNGTTPGLYELYPYFVFYL